jgi:hypothetical protein
LEFPTKPYKAEVPAAEWWKSLNAQEREFYTKDEAKYKRGGRGLWNVTKKGPKNTSPTKGGKEDDETVVRKKTSLYQPAAQLEVDPPVEDPSIAPTPAEGSDNELDPDGPSDSDEPLDNFGTYLPKRPTPRNGDQPQNRFAVEPHFTFEDDEIGIREHHTKRNNKNELSYSGMDPYPNPKKFHFDQVARALNSAKNKAEDLDQELVAEFKVHPTYGLVIRDSVNPDWSEDSSFNPPNTWAEPLPESKSYVFIEDGQHNLYNHDHEKPAWHNSRSNWMVKTDRAFDEETTKDRVARVLEAYNTREEEEEKSGITKSKKPVIESSLVEVSKHELAEMKAINEKEARRIQQIREGLNKPRSVWPSSSAGAPQRSLPYDPTKDTGNGTGYQTPYRQISQAPREDTSALSILATEAGRSQDENRRPSQPIAYFPPRWGDQIQQKKVMREEDGRSVRAPLRSIPPAFEQSRRQPHNVGNSQFTPQQYSPQGQAAPPQNPGPSHAHPHPAHQTAYQGFAQIPPHPGPHQQPLQSPPQPSQQLPQQHHQAQFSPQRTAAQASAPGGLRALAPAPPSGRSSQPTQQPQPQPQNSGWIYRYGRWLGEDNGQ